MQVYRLLQENRPARLRVSDSHLLQGEALSNFPRVLYVAMRQGIYLAADKLTAFDGMQDEPIGVYKLEEPVERLSISGPGKQETAKNRDCLVDAR